MPSTLRRCKQCGEVKPAIENFRTYYHRNAKTMYKTCKACERINQRLKYLNRKTQRTSADETEIKLIKELYELQRSQGLRPPKGEEDAIDIVAMIAAQQERGVPVEPVSEIPHELQHWLSVDLQAFTPEALEQVGDELMTKYRKTTGVDPITLVPIYDDKYRDILNEILKRFDAYEDIYYDDIE
ncbi:hypothetical protein D3C75_140390 [compost metagenome]